MTTVAKRWPSRMSHANERNPLSFGVGYVKDGVINSVTQITRMCSSEASRQTTSGGLSPSGKVTSLSICA